MRKVLSPKHFFVVIISLTSFAPLYLMVIMSTQTTEEIFRGLSLTPGAALRENLNTVLNPLFFSSYMNSLTVSVSATIICLLFSSMAGYGVVAYKWKLRNAFYNFVLITMMIPVSLRLIGYLQQMRFMGLSGTLAPLILVWVANGFGVFWMTQYMKSSLKMEIIESARIDGSGELSTFFKIVVPCIRPALGTLALTIFLWSWNMYLLPLVMISNPLQYTIPLFIQTLGTEYRDDYAARITGLMLAIVPLIIVFSLGSKNFIKGLTAGAIKE